jgi:hypothetical protein
LPPHIQEQVPLDAEELCPLEHKGRHGRKLLPGNITDQTTAATPAVSVLPTELNSKRVSTQRNGTVMQRAACKFKDAEGLHKD